MSPAKLQNVLDYSLKLIKKCNCQHHSESANNRKKNPRIVITFNRNKIYVNLYKVKYQPKGWDYFQLGVLTFKYNLFQLD